MVLLSLLQIRKLLQLADLGDASDDRSARGRSEVQLSWLALIVVQRDDDGAALVELHTLHGIVHEQSREEALDCALSDKVLTLGRHMDRARVLERRDNLVYAAPIIERDAHTVDELLRNELLRIRLKRLHHDRAC